MAPGDVDADANKPVTAEDLKSLETTLSSSLATQLQIAQTAQNKQMQEMMNTFMASLNKPISSSSPPSVVAPTMGEQHVNVESEDSENIGEKEEDNDDEDKDKDKNDASKSSGNTGPKAYHEEPPPLVYSPDPRIPHHHIVNQGPPPPLTPKDFERWQSKMMSYLNSSSIELWIIVQVGFKAHNPNNMTRR